jgi:hypothetical protein
VPALPTSTSCAPLMTSRSTSLPLSRRNLAAAACRDHTAAPPHADLARARAAAEVDVERADDATGATWSTPRAAITIRDASRAPTSTSRTPMPTLRSISHRASGAEEDEGARRSRSVRSSRRRRPLAAADDQPAFAADIGSDALCLQTGTSESHASRAGLCSAAATRVRSIRDCAI